MAGSRFHGDGFQTLVASATAPDSAISLTVNASTVHRIWLYEINMGNIGTPPTLYPYTTSANARLQGPVEGL